MNALIARLQPTDLEHRARRTDAVAVGLTAGAFAYAIVVGRVTGASEDLAVSAHMHGTLAEAAALLVRNGLICAFLIALAHPPARTPVVLTALGQMLAGAIPLGTAAIGGLIAGHPEGLAHLPHAPFELLAAALAGAWPLRALSVPPTAAATRRRATIVLALLTLAAALETFAVPHA